MADTNNEATSPAPAALVVKGIPVGVPVPVDAELDPDSNNPVNNKAVSEKFDEIDEQLKDNVIIQTPGTTYTVNGGYLLGYGDNTGLMRLRVPLNFVTKNTNYSVAYTNMGVDGIGSIPQSSISVLSKNKDYVLLSITHSSIAYAKVYAITSFFLTLTFA